MRAALALLLSAVISGCSSGVNTRDAAQSGIQEVRSYAIASCLSYQENPYLADQGDAWASVVIQRTRGSIEPLAEVAEVVKRQVETGGMAVMREARGRDKALPILYCYEMLERPTVRAAIDEAVSSLTPT